MLVGSHTNFLNFGAKLRMMPSHNDRRYYRKSNWPKIFQWRYMRPNSCTWPY